MLVDMDAALEAVAKTGIEGVWGTACVEAMQAAIRGIATVPLTTDEKVDLLIAQKCHEMKATIDKTFGELWSYQVNSIYLTDLVKQPMYRIVRPECLRACQAIEAMVK